jgi:16S rRNA (cytosine1402-N4)-methyltransferase
MNGFLLDNGDEPADKKATLFTSAVPVLPSSVNDDVNTGQSPPLKPQRRVRYNGKYPRNFNERYKELDGDVGTVQKVLAKGMTPAGQHVPILLRECLYHLGLSSSDTLPTSGSTTTTTPTAGLRTTGPHVCVDCTLGYGGHASHILQLLLRHDDDDNTKAHDDHRLICFDRDPIEIAKATERLYRLIRGVESREPPLSSISSEPAVTGAAAAAARLPTNGTSSHSSIRPPVIVTTVNRNFRNVRVYLDEEHRGHSNENGGPGTSSPWGTVTALLADLGVSSMQMDDATRGFTYKREGPLDMRMEQGTANSDNNHDTTTTNETAYELLARLSVPQLTKMLQENSDEPHAKIIAQAILGGTNSKGRRRTIADNAVTIPSTTVALATVVRDAVRPLLMAAPMMAGAKPKSVTATGDAALPQPRPRGDSPKVKKELDSTVARVMQALRIAVNQEFESLEQLLDDLPYILAPGGRAVFLTFHSGEDRRVKKAFKEGHQRGIYASWSRDVVRPSATERRDNPRSSCCKLRWVVRSDQAPAVAVATTTNTTAATATNKR